LRLESGDGSVSHRGKRPPIWAYNRPLIFILNNSLTIPVLYIKLSDSGPVPSSTPLSVMERKAIWD